jgi:hypothetical protein
MTTLDAKGIDADGFPLSSIARRKHHATVDVPDEQSDSSTAVDGGHRLHALRIQAGIF